jgi:hypothetical protein
MDELSSLTFLFWGYIAESGIFKIIRQDNIVNMAKFTTETKDLIKVKSDSYTLTLITK